GWGARLWPGHSRGPAGATGAGAVARPDPPRAQHVRESSTLEAPRRKRAWPLDQPFAAQMFRSERGLCPRNRSLGGGSEGGRSPPPSNVLGRELVKPGAIVPGDLGLGLLAHALQADELLDGHGEESIGVRVVSGDHDVVVADGLHYLAERLLVGVGGDVALAEEVLAGELGDLHLRARPEL